MTEDELQDLDRLDGEEDDNPFSDAPPLAPVLRADACATTTTTTPVPCPSESGTEREPLLQNSSSAGAPPQSTALQDHPESPLGLALSDDVRCEGLSRAAATYRCPQSGVSALHVAAGNGSSVALRALAFIAFKFLFTGRPVFDSCSSKKQ